MHGVPEGGCMKRFAVRFFKVFVAVVLFPGCVTNQTGDKTVVAEDTPS